MKEFLWSVRAYYEDTDSGGVVYYANYLRFMERARTELLRAHGIEQTKVMAQDGVVFAVRAANVQYFKPIRFDDLMEVTVQIRKVGRASIDFYQTIRPPKSEGMMYCSADIKIACVSAEGFRPRRVPPYILKVIDNDPESVDS